ncbi:MAG: glutamine synthetase III [bacterium]|nr:glutamine synthetase III [bacterium]
MNSRLLAIDIRERYNAVFHFGDTANNQINLVEGKPMDSTNKRRTSLLSLTSYAKSSNDSMEKITMPTELFGENVFSLSTMRTLLPKPIYQHMKSIIEQGTTLDTATADVIANAMKDWAMERGASHYSHWFHPLTGLTAEKHTAFLTPVGEGGVISEFSGKDLLRGEPDASSFPSGGIRSTFEARGYTGWDPTSPAFIMEGLNGKTLCIPSIFLGWGGQALDKKTPLLRSLEALNKQGMRLLRLFGNKTAKRIHAYLGCEQEYFLIDRIYYLQRPDLIAVGRTLYGAKPPKGQELEDHYFGAIKERVLAYMQDLEHELYKLGIPVNTRHNEVAPSQFEIAPIYEDINLATDHNMLMMQVMKTVAHRHGFECLLHEKPFARINGSGKHNNWSIMDDEGNNLVDPGTTPLENAQFLVVLAAVMRAIHLNGDLLRVTVASAANDHRLGANEAPPAIISIYLGAKLTQVVESIIDPTTVGSMLKETINIGVSTLPPLPAHDSDRNRTSPFAFTGNKFEFRAVGSSQSVSMPNTVLNTIVADALKEICDALEVETKAGKEFNAAVKELVKRLFTEHQAVVFDGDGYTSAWHEEAAKRGLPNLKNTVEATPVFLAEKSRKVFSDHRVLSEEELESRYHIKLEKFIKNINIEATLVAQIGHSMIVPAIFEYQKEIAKSIDEMSEVLEDFQPKRQLKLLRQVAEGLNLLLDRLDELEKVHEEADSHREELYECSKLYQERVRPAMDAVREIADSLELIVDDALWPLPKYHEMLFVS